jgi:predicted MFS family arabinose efflux permease
MNAASIFGRTLPNFVAQKWGNHNVIIPCTFLTGALVWAFMGATDIAGVIVFTIFYGFFSGGFITMCVPCCASYASNVSEIGTRNGLQAIIFAFAVLTGSPIAGALLSPPQFRWWRPLTFASVVIMSGTFCMIIARAMLARRRGTNAI